MKNMQTNFLRFILVAITLAILSVGLLMTIQITTAEQPINLGFPQLSFLITVALILVAGLAIIYYLFKLVTIIARNQAFSNQSLTIVNSIKNIILAISIITLGIFPMGFYIAHIDDAPGFMLLVLSIAIVPFAVYVFTSVLASLLESAVALQQDQDLTV